MKTNLLRLLLPLAAFGFVAAGTASAQTAIPGGTHSSSYVISKPGSYYLAANRVMSNGNDSAIAIQVPDVTIDLRGHTVSFTPGAVGPGVGIQADTAVNVEIRNGSIQDTPGKAIYVPNTGSAGLRLIDLRIAGTQGVYSNAKNTTIDRCQIIDTVTYAAIAIDAVGGMVRNCTISNVPSSVGINVTGGTMVTGNVISDTSFSAIVVFSKSGGLVSDNTISNANLSGHQAHGGIRIMGQGVMVSRNNVVGAKSHGIRFESVSGVADGNVVCLTAPGSNGASGVGIQTFTTATIVRNNSGSGNAAAFLSGAATNGGGNVSN